MEKINLNGKEFVDLESYNSSLIELEQLKAKENKSMIVKRFPIEKEVKIINSLRKIFNIWNNADESCMLEIENKVVTDPCNICGIIGKSEEGKRIVSKLIDGEERGNIKSMSEFNFKSEAGIENTAKFSIEYVKKIMAILEVSSDSLFITTKKDFVIKLENEHFAFILAPRVED